MKGINVALIAKVKFCANHEQSYQALSEITWPL